MGWVGTPQPRLALRALVQPRHHYRLATAIARLPAGWFTVLERASDSPAACAAGSRFDAASSRGGIVKPRSWPARHALCGRQSGVGLTKGAHGETLLWLISDDNFNPLQRNILLLFELAK
jgi:hypothetical protein